MKCYFFSKTTKMEKSDLMTIEFLRARLLSERSVSKTARERADELASRVSCSKFLLLLFDLHWLSHGIFFFFICISTHFVFLEEFMKSAANFS